MSDSPLRAVCPDEVYRTELDRIVNRRQAAFGAAAANEPGDVRANLVGLASSGGGLRSATFNLGLLQALRRYGLLPFVDYHASVSGGGYTAAYLARAAHDTHKFHAEAQRDKSVGAAEGAIALTDHLRFRNCGSYLRRPVEFLAEYVFCTSIVLTLFAAGLFALALLIAILWRVFDFQTVGDRLGVVGLNIELFTAFIPCVALLVLWIVLASARRVERIVRHATRQTNKTRQCLVRGAALVVITLLLAACGLSITSDRVPPILVPPLAFLWLLLAALVPIGVVWMIPNKTRQQCSDWLSHRRHWLGPSALLIAGLLCAWPFVQRFLPGWMQLPFYPIAYEQGQFVLHERAFVGAVFGFVGVFFLVCWLIFGTKLVTRRVFLALLFSPAVAIMVLIANGSIAIGWLSQVSGVGGDLTSQRLLREPLMAFVALCVLVLVRYRRLLQSARPDASFWERVAFGIVVSGIVIGVPMVLIGWVGREGISGFAKYRDPELLESDILDWPAYLDLWADRQLGPSDMDRRPYLQDVDTSAVRQDRLLGELSWARNQYTIFNPEHGFIARLGMLIRSRFQPGDSRALVPEYLRSLAKERGDRKRFVQNAKVKAWLGSAELNHQLAEEIRQRCLSSDKDDDFERTTCLEWIEEESKGNAEQPALLSYADRATDHLSKENEMTKESASDDVSKNKEKKGTEFSFQVTGPYWQGADSDRFNLRSFNRLLLETLYPKIFKSRVMVSTPIVVGQDQITRAGYLALSSLIFIGLFLLVPVNQLSPFHNFYRRMLDSKFLSPTHVEMGSKLKLSELQSDVHGGPYPLFMGSLYFVEDQPVDAFGAQEHLLSSRSVPLLMSPEFCGTREFGFERSGETPWSNFGVADAVAISGAALSPLAFSTGPIYWILSAFNLRTGQWLRNPKRGGESYLKPVEIFREFFGVTRAESLIVSDPDSGEVASESRCETWRVGVAADGGYCDFLGIEPLLERKCRLIIAVDAGCNQGSDEFRSLGDLMRKVRLERGIEILDWDDDRPLDISRLQRDEETRLSPQHFVMGRIVYPAPSGDAAPSSADVHHEGVLVYIQMTMNGDEGADLTQYHRANKTFPDEPTSNQFFDSTQVEVYRSLGFHTGKTICFEFGTELERVGRNPQQVAAAEFLIQRLSDNYALAGSAERKVDERDFSSRLPFFPELDAMLGDRFRNRLASLDSAKTAASAEREAGSLLEFERSADYRRKIIVEIEAIVGGLDEVSHN